MSFINDIPQVVLGVVTGLLPSVLLAVLMALLPIFLRKMASIGGDPTRSAVELTVQNYYFAFQIVQVFLVATLGAAASSSVQTIINDPTSVTSLLASKIPLASNFYLSYFILQGLGVFASILLGLSGLVIAKVLSKILDKTPRKIYNRWINLSGLGWGTVFPIYTNLFAIGICYACIAPLVLIFAAIGLYFFYFAFKYNFLYVSNLNIDTKGRVYPRALQQVFVGIYIAELCLVGLFAIAMGSSPQGAIGPLILMILLLIFTALYNISLNSALGPLIEYLPKTLEYEERSLLARENPQHDTENKAVNTNGGSHAQTDVEKNGVATDGYAEPASAKNTQKKPNFFSKWLRPDKYEDYETLRKLVPRELDLSYPEEVEAEAYFNPAIISQPQLVWIPRDTMGISRQEIRDNGEHIQTSDEGATLDDKGRVAWDRNEKPPVYEEKIYY